MADESKNPNASEDGIFRRIDAGVRATANGMTFGAADYIAGAANSLVSGAAGMAHRFIKGEAIVESPTTEQALGAAMEDVGKHVDAEHARTVEDFGKYPGQQITADILGGAAMGGAGAVRVVAGKTLGEAVSQIGRVWFTEKGAAGFVTSPEEMAAYREICDSLRGKEFSDYLARRGAEDAARIANIESTTARDAAALAGGGFAGAVYTTQADAQDFAAAARNSVDAADAAYNKAHKEEEPHHGLPNIPPTKNDMGQQR